MAVYQIIDASWNEHEAELTGIRQKVFVQEHQIPQAIEFDGQDGQAAHFLAVDAAGTAVGTARILASGQIGHMAVLPPHRGNGVGRLLLEAVMKHAREEGHYGVFLHAQEPVSDFYAKAGFVMVGSPFDEAGIPHVKMTQELAVEFVPPKVTSRPVLDAVRQPAPDADVEPPPKKMVKIESHVEGRDQILAISKYARRCVRIYSQELDPLLFDNSDFAELLSEFARLSDHTEVQILIHSASRMVKQGHRLLTLMTRIPSKVHIRLVPEEQLDDERTFVLVDDQSILLLSKSVQCVGFADYDNRPLTRQFVEEFQNYWNQSREDPSVRSIAMSA